VARLWAQGQIGRAIAKELGIPSSNVLPIVPVGNAHARGYYGYINRSDPGTADFEEPELFGRSKVAAPFSVKSNTVKGAFGGIPELGIG
jgi:hypothetical protein